MKQLNVRYEPCVPIPKLGEFVFSTDITVWLNLVTNEIINKLRTDVNSGKIDEVVLCGPDVCTGWRVGVRRKVRFVERATVDEQDAIAQTQASMRIVELTKEKAR